MNIITRYDHLARALVRKGQKIRKGEETGIGGSSGFSTGPHFHFKILINRRARNPERFVNLGRGLESVIGG